MLTIVRTNTKNNEIKASLNALLVRLDCQIWLGQVTVRVQNRIKELLLNDRSSDSIVGKISSTFSNSKFELLSQSEIRNLPFYEIYINKKLTK